MIDHVGIPVRNHAQARAFYRQALAPLGIGVVMEVTKEQTGGREASGFGANGKPFFWISEGAGAGPLHIALVADSRAQVDAFYAAALQAGAKDHGAPGVRAHYHPDYYGAFVIDPNGVNLEAVCHKPAR